MTHMNKLFLYLLISLIPFLKISYSDEILIESEELIITNEPLTTTFIGNVYAFDNEIKLWSDKILILYTETESQIDQIKCFGNSKLVRENQEIISENITYFVIDKKIYAKGNIILTQDENVMKGNELSVDLVKSTSIMKSSQNNKVTVKINNNE
jgi:lipopolysaccharide transport protein LptA